MDSQRPAAEHYDLLVLGHVSKDIIVTPEEQTEGVGGAVVYSCAALSRLKAKILALTKVALEDLETLEVLKAMGVPVVCRNSQETTSIRNTYHTADRERRTCEAIGQAAPFSLDDIPEGVTADVYYMGGLMLGEFPEALIAALAERGKTAVDVQGFLRVNENGPMVFRDWDAKTEVIPSIHYLKTDAVEAEILTGLKDREAAAQTLYDWGAHEVVLTHNAEVMVCADDQLHRAPFTPKNLSGRTGRGDTCFGSYCYWRKEHSPEESCRFAAALTCLRMEVPGPFTGSVQDVREALDTRY